MTDFPSPDPTHDTAPSDVENTSTAQVMSELSKIPLADMDPKLQNFTSTSFDILEEFVTAVSEDEVKDYHRAEEKLVCLLLELDTHPTDGSGDRKQAVDYVIHCTKLLDLHAQRKAKDKDSDEYHEDQIWYYEDQELLSLDEENAEVEEVEEVEEELDETEEVELEVEEEDVEDHDEDSDKSHTLNRNVQSSPVVFIQ
ncbi:Hypp9633 [Branchiostoma lanceolatum]|uniref:Hypp9633 protein n=1 Tax=Branchiostoma lanceolatum TaxID=7740 RepID=A0A8S4MNS6_BRALA|nr:Hypp9633 [Branchiostoma lanceolatum]